MSLTDEEKRLIGGSDVAALAGLSPYKKPIDVFRRIVLGEDDEAQSVAARRGTLMEPVIREIVRQDQHLTLLGPRKLRDPKRSYVRVSLDDVSKEEAEIPQEFKSVSPFAAKEYGPSESNEFPEYHLCQVQFYVAETGAPRARLHAFIGVDELRSYTIHADADLQGMLMEVVERFHRDHILTGKPPVADGSESFSKYIAQRYPASRGHMLSATPEAEEWAAEYRAASAQLVTATERRDKAKNHLKEFIGDADGVNFADGERVTWKSVQGRKKTDWQALQRSQQIPQDVVEQFTSRGAGYRAFRPSWKEQNDE